MECNWIEVYDSPIGGELLNPLTLYSGQTVYLDITNMPADYEFLGWKDLYGNLLDDTTIKLVEGGRYETTIVCGGGYVAYTKTAQSKICLVTVMCDTNEGSVTRGDGYDICGGTVEISARPSCCYEFATWNDSSSDRTLATRTVTVQGVQTYTASFTKKNFSVTVGLNDSDLGSVSIDRNTVQCGDTFIITATPNENCVFDHWEPGNYTTQTTAIKYNCGEPTNYVAYFSKIPRYTITYHYNYSGSVEPDIVDSFFDGENVTYRTVSASGHTFMGWAWEPDAETPDILPGETGTFTYGENIDLYGIWQRAVRYRCYYYGKPDNPSYSYDDVIEEKYAGETFTLYTPLAIAGYTFQGWMICDHGLTPSPDANVITGNYTMISGGLDAHAVWKPEGSTTYTLTYIHNNGTAQQTTINGISAGTVVTIKSPAELGITYAYHTFVNWTPGNYVGGSTITFPQDNVTLTAVWDSVRVTLTYDITDSDSGTAPSPQTVYQGDSVNLADGSTFSKTGYIFQGWTANSGSVVTLNSPITLTDNMTVYPVWSRIPKFTVTYNTVDGCEASDPNEYNSGAVVTVAACKCPRESGCNCDGWTDQLGNIHLNGTQFNIYQNMYMTPYYDCCEIGFKTNNPDAVLVLDGNVVRWDTVYNVYGGSEFDVVEPKDCCFRGWLDADDHLFLQPGDGSEGYEYRTIPYDCSNIVDHSLIRVLSDSDFVRELSNPGRFDPNQPFILNRETGEIAQLVAKCKNEEYDFGSLCGGTVIAIVSCAWYIEKGFDQECRYESAPGNYTSFYDYIENERWVPSTRYVSIRIRGVEYYYEYVKCRE